MNARTAPATTPTPGITKSLAAFVVVAAAAPAEVALEIWALA